MSRDQHRAASRRRERPSGLRPRRADRAGGRALAGADRLPQGSGPRGAGGRRLGTFGLDAARGALDELVARFGRDNVAVELSFARDPLADERYDALDDAGRRDRVAVVATTGAHYHGPPRRPLATAMAAVRARRSLDEMDGWLPAWADAQLRTGEEMAQRFARWPGAVEAAARIGAELAFPIELIAPQLPPFPVPRRPGPR